ncbi:hypothetical protein JCM5296_005791 [Sporobolomyces johnsonii]
MLRLARPLLASSRAATLPAVLHSSPRLALAPAAVASQWAGKSALYGAMSAKRWASSMEVVQTLRDPPRPMTG